MRALACLLWIASSFLPQSEAVTCSEIAQCEHDSQAYATAQAKADMPTVCNLLGKSVACMEVAMDDCKRQSNFPENRLQQAQQAVEMHKKQVLSFCPRTDDPNSRVFKPEDSSSTTASDYASLAGHSMTSANGPGKPSCSQIMTCMFDLDHFKAALKENRLTEACGLINPSVRCLRLAIKDCQEAQIIDKDDTDIVNASHSLTAAEALLENYCGYTKDNANTKNRADVDNSEMKTNDGQKKNIASEQQSQDTTNQEPAHSSQDAAEDSAHDKGKGIADSTGQRHGHTSRRNSASVHLISLQVLLLVPLLYV